MSVAAERFVERGFVAAATTSLRRPHSFLRWKEWGKKARQRGTLPELGPPLETPPQRPKGAHTPFENPRREVTFQGSALRAGKAGFAPAAADDEDEAEVSRPGVSKGVRRTPLVAAGGLSRGTQSKVSPLIRRLCLLSPPWAKVGRRRSDETSFHETLGCTEQSLSQRRWALTAFGPPCRICRSRAGVRSARQGGMHAHRFAAGPLAQEWRDCGNCVPPASAAGSGGRAIPFTQGSQRKNGAHDGCAPRGGSVFGFTAGRRS